MSTAKRQGIVLENSLLSHEYRRVQVNNYRENIIWACAAVKLSTVRSQIKVCKKSPEQDI